MSETQTRHVGAYVRANTPLRLLYILGTVGAAIGVIIFFVSSSAIAGGGSVPATAMMWQVIGSGLVTVGVLAVIGGAVAHAINWQILNR